MECSNKSSSLSQMDIKVMFDNNDVKQLIKGVASLIHTDIVENIKNNKTASMLLADSLFYCFSEESYFNELTSLETVENLSKMPLPGDIEIFILSLKSLLNFSAESIVISQIYMNRLLIESEPLINIHTWRPLLLLSIILAQKMWDEGFKTNSDFAEVYSFFSTEQLNQMEMNFLNIIKYNTHVKCSLFVNFYLTLKETNKDENIEQTSVNNELKEKLKKQSKKFAALVKNKANTINI
jgi:hypothetical protein